MKGIKTFYIWIKNRFSNPLIINPLKHKSTHINTDLLYESPDKGKTIYKRKIGEKKREQIK